MTVYYVHNPAHDLEGYGIKVVTEEIIPDISFDKAAISSFVDTLNELELCPEHLYDAIEDFIG